MKRWIPIVGVAVIVAVAVGQPQGGPGGGPGGGFAQFREMRTKALDALQQDVTKLRTSMEAMTPSGANIQDMSEEDRAKFRDQMMQRRDEQQKLIGDIETQLAMLKGRRQLQTEHDDAMASLEALQSQAKQENATKTADMIAKMIKEKQDKFDKMMEQMGGPPM
jgi:hypothetical protein